ncbi:hypothetical protein IKE67_09675 [bacterium]|nr:hypothetical protein [bacterium]
MVYGMGQSDAAFRMMNTAHSQISSINSIGPDSDMQALAKADKQNSINMLKDQLTYQIMEKMDEQDDKLKKDKIKRDFSYFD